MSASQSAVMLCGWRVKTDMVHSTCAWINVSVAGKTDPSLAHAIRERLAGELLMIKRYTTRNVGQFPGRPAEYRWRPLLNAAKFG